MTQRFSFPKFAVALATATIPWFASLAVAQEVPPPPPAAVSLAQAPAPEPTLVGPTLPGAEAPFIAPEAAPLPTPAPVAGVAPAPVIIPNPAPVPGDPTPADALPTDPNLAVPDADVEAFARGPVHEAFADVYDLNPVTNEIVPNAPPAAVDELPPEQAPTGDNVQWIAGYWGWDAESKDFLWVSGVWRDIPPGRRWVPGYWAEVTGGHQWVSGFWADAKSQELAYLPPPPESLEVGPNAPPPSDDQQWVPGNWAYVDNNYRWTPGYYTPCQQDYMWVPNQYSYTPSGCVYVPGYWDYRFARRGTLFTPVRFRRSLLGYGYGRPAFYRPRYSVNMASFLIHLFVRPRCRSFYYGDYYGNQYANLGYSPWYRRSFVNHRIHDPALSFYRWDSHRRGVDFDHSVGTWHQRYESNADIRPPRLVSGQNQFIARHQGNRAAELAVMSHRFDDATRAQQSGAALRHIGQADLATLRETRQVNRQLETARRQTELGSHTALGKHQPGAAGQAAAAHRLALGDMPAHLKERTQASVAHAERLHANHHVAGPQIIGNGGTAGTRAEIIHQQNVDRRATHQASRLAPTPDTAIHHQPRAIDRTPLNNGPLIQGTHVARQHHVPQQLNSAPVMRHNPVVNNPVQHHIQRQAPVQQHIPVQRHVPAQQHIPVQRHMPAQHHHSPPAQHHAPHHRR